MQAIASVLTVTALGPLANPTAGRFLMETTATMGRAILTAAAAAAAASADGGDHHHNRELFVAGMDISSMLSNPQQLIDTACNLPFGMGIQMMKTQLRTVLTMEGMSADEEAAVPIDSIVDCLCSHLDVSDPAIATLVQLLFSSASDSFDAYALFGALESAIPALLRPTNFCNPTCSSAVAALMRAIPQMGSAAIGALPSTGDWRAASGPETTVTDTMAALSRMSADVTDCICTADAQGFLQSISPFFSTSPLPEEHARTAANFIFSDQAVCATGCKQLASSLLAGAIGAAFPVAKAELRTPASSAAHILAGGGYTSTPVPAALAAPTLQPLAEECLCGGSMDYASFLEDVTGIYTRFLPSANSTSNSTAGSAGRPFSMLGLVEGVEVEAEYRMNSIFDTLTVGTSSSTQICGSAACNSIITAYLTSVPDTPTPCSHPVAQECQSRCVGDCADSHRAQAADAIDTLGDSCSSFCLPSCGLGFTYVPLEWWTMCDSFNGCLVASRQAPMTGTDSTGLPTSPVSGGTGTEGGGGGGSGGSGGSATNVPLTLLAVVVAVAGLALAWYAYTQLRRTKQWPAVVTPIGHPAAPPTAQYDMELNSAALEAERSADVVNQPAGGVA